LNTKKVSQQKFDQVIDIEFEEFLAPAPAAPAIPNPLLSAVNRFRQSSNVVVKR